MVVETYRHTLKLKEVNEQFRQANMIRDEV